MDVLAAQGFISFTYSLLDIKAYVQSSSFRIYQSCDIPPRLHHIIITYSYYSFGDTLGFGPNLFCT